MSASSRTRALTEPKSSVEYITKPNIHAREDTSHAKCARIRRLGWTVSISLKERADLIPCSALPSAVLTYLLNASRYASCRDVKCAVTSPTTSVGVGDALAIRRRGLSFFGAGRGDMSPTCSGVLILANASSSRFELIALE